MLYIVLHRITDPEFEGDWTPEEEYLHEGLLLQYSRSLYFSLIITYGNDLGKRDRKPREHVETGISPAWNVNFKLREIQQISSNLGNLIAGYNIL